MTSNILLTFILSFLFSNSNLTLHIHVSRVNLNFESIGFGPTNLPKKLIEFDRNRVMVKILHIFFFSDVVKILYDFKDQIIAKKKT